MGFKLDSKQLEAVEHGDGPLLIIAGAGTGKTTVITERIKHLILEKKVEPQSILALTFTEKASLEMEERIDKAMPYGYTQMWISTFHSFCDRILRQEAIHIGLNPSYKLLTEAETVLFLRKNIFNFGLSYFRPLGNPNKFLEALISHFSRLKDEDVSPAEYLTWAQNQKSRIKNQNDEEKENLDKYIELARAYEAYEELKIKEGVFDFADLISKTLKLLRERKNILKSYQEQFKYILVDEFQDTNYAQNELAILLAGDKQNITVVGDDDQSIYRFRGSSVSNIIQFRKQFPKAKVVTLTTNYRSTSEILDRSYELIQNNNPDRLEIKEKIDKKLTSARNIKGEKIEFIYTQRVEDEADLVAKKILELHPKYDYKDFAVLVRANDHSESFARAFQRLKIPYQFLGPGRLFHQEEIKNLIAYLKVLYNFEDSTSLFRVLNMPIFELEALEIANLLNLARKRNYTLFEAMEKVEESYLKNETKEKIKKILEMIKRHISLIKKETGGQIIYYFLQDCGMLKKMIDSKSEKDEIESKNIAKFFDKLKTYEVEHTTATVYDIVDWIDLSMQMGESPLASTTDWSDVNAVNILSIHSSKGLEFPVVFLVNLVAGRFPTRERKEVIPIPQELIKEILPTGDYHLEEERRLFYVGMTRSRDLLFLSASNYYREGKRERKISPFVYEALGKNEVEKKILEAKPQEVGQLSILDWSGVDKLSEEVPQDRVKSNGVITYLSYSQIQTFDICPLHYKLKYIFRIPTPPTAAQSFGTSVHATLRDFYQLGMRGDELNANKALEILEKNWINEGYSSREHEKKIYEKAKEIITNYLKANYDKTRLPLALEMPFEFKIENLRIGGRIDRIDELPGNKIEIIDYKTGSNMPDDKKLLTDTQLTVYALAANLVADKVLKRKPEEVVLSLLYLESNKKLTTTRTMEQLEEAKKTILEKAKLIESSEFLCSGSSLCGFCEYKMLCTMVKD
jgi:DNA helicase II / ATP-dependent DNA helicase PcrA